VKLLEIRLKNFRQFEGENALHLAQDPNKNVTVVYGANGSGKTTLLNAFTWCLYGELSRDLMFQDRLISEGVWLGLPVGDVASVSVSIDFEHGGDVYTVTRGGRAAKVVADGEQKLTIECRLVRQSIDGAPTDIRNPGDFIDQILPQRLHRFFFLNGERFEHLLSSDAFADIDSAVKTILGIEIVERGIRHLKEVERKLNADYRRLGSASDAELLDELDDLNEQLAAVDKLLEENDQELRALHARLVSLDQTLASAATAAGLHSERRSLEQEYERMTAALQSLLKRRSRAVADRGFLTLVGDAVTKFLAATPGTGSSQQAALVSAAAIEQLLERGTCVCGCDLTLNPDARESLELLANAAPQTALEDVWVRSQSRVAEWPTVHEPAIRRELAEIQVEEQEITTTLATLSERISEIESELRKVPDPDLTEVESERSGVLKARDRLRKDEWELTQKRKAIDVRLFEAQRRLRAAEAASAKGAVAQRRLVAVEDVRLALSRLLELRTEDVRGDLDARIKRIYSTVVKKRQIPAVSPSFELLLQEKEPNGRLVSKAMSTGEAQVLTLAFVGALADLARDTQAASTDAARNPLVSAAGGVFPLVADAIFGTLDESFRREIATLLPQLAPQVILFLSKSQSRGEVDSQLRDRLGAAAVIDANMARTDISVEDVEVDGRSYPYVTSTGADFDTSRIVQIREPEGTDG